jgi:hypothetical protein
MKPAQLLLLPFVLAALAKVIYSYNQRRMSTADFLLWILVWIGTASVITFPEATSLINPVVGLVMHAIGRRYDPD